MTGIAELFRELSEPDFYDVSAQLELFVWLRQRRKRERQQRHRERRQLNARLRAKRNAYQREWFARKRADAAWAARHQEQKNAWARARRAA